MIATFTPDVLTRLTFEQAVEPMRAALDSRQTIKTTDPVLALALAKNALETGRWQSCHCWNFGNVKAGDDYAGMFTSFACGENLADGVHWFLPDGTDRNLTKGTTRRPILFEVPPGHPQTRFRAYANQYDGSFEYVDFVATHYQAAWASILQGDAIGFVHQLKLGHYFTADEAPYARGVLSMQREFEQRLKGMPVDGTPADEIAARACVSHLAVMDVAGRAGADVSDWERATPPTGTPIA